MYLRVFVISILIWGNVPQGKCASSMLHHTAYSDTTALGKFWTNLEKHCEQAYEGTLTAGGREGDGFSGKELTMRVIKCTPEQIKIPFFVGDDQSRTWILTKKNGLVELKHDHRHEDGSDDKVTMYGGTSTNLGTSGMQIFPADPHTCTLLPYACGNIWWITLDDKTFTYNLRRIGSDRLFTVTFNLEKSIESTRKPWGWKE